MQEDDYCLLGDRRREERVLLFLHLVHARGWGDEKREDFVGGRGSLETFFPHSHRFLP